MLTYSFGSDHLVYWLMNISLFELRVRHHWNGSAALSAESVAVELGRAESGFAGVPGAEGAQQAAGESGRPAVADDDVVAEAGVVVVEGVASGWTKAGEGSSAR